VLKRNPEVPRRGMGSVPGEVSQSSEPDVSLPPAEGDAKRNQGEDPGSVP